MKNGYDLTRELITILSNMDFLFLKKNKETNISEIKILDQKLDILEENMHDIKKQLRDKNCYAESLKLIRIIANIDVENDKKNNKLSYNQEQLIDRKIDSLELEMYKLKDYLKNK